MGRLAVTVHSHPEMFPVNHLVDDGSLLVSTADGTKLAAAAGHVVAFEIDGYDLGGGTAWSVIVKGVAAGRKCRLDGDAMSPRPPRHQIHSPHSRVHVAAAAATIDPGWLA